MEDIIYLKKLDSYKEIIDGKVPLFIKKIIYLWRNLFGIVKQEKSNEFKIWVLPFIDKEDKEKLAKIIEKQVRKKRLLGNTKIVLSNSLMSKATIQILNRYHVQYIDGNVIKKILLFKVLEYINHLQNKELAKRDIAILVNENNQINNNIIMNLAMQCKTLKIVSKKIYQFKNLEQKLYEDYGIAIQFSNSYQKSLLKAEIIVNLDFNEVELNEYTIFPKAIVINTSQPIKIKTKLFSGIIVNSCEIKFLKKIKEIFNKNSLLEKFDSLLLYESIENWKSMEYSHAEEKIEEHKVHILNLIGNNGRINQKEFK